MGGSNHQRSWLLAGVAHGFLLCVPLWAQPPVTAPPPSGTPVALVNIRQVFEHHARYRAAMADLQNDVQNAQAQFALRQKQVAELDERLRTYKADSPEYKELEAQIAQLAAQTQADMAVKRREFLTREAKIYYDAYMEVCQYTAEFSRQYQIALVLAYDGEPINANDRQSIIRGVNRNVVYQQGLDITQAIVERLNRGVAPAEVSNRPFIPQRR